MAHGAAFGDTREGTGQVRGGTVPALLGEARVAGDIEEADRRRPFETAVETGFV